MSLLLDALNKADQERKRNEATPGIDSNHGYASDHNTRSISLAVIIAVVAGFFILLAAIYWLGQRSTAVAPTVAPTTSSMPAISPSTSSAIHKNLPSSATQTSTNPEQEPNNAEQDVASLYAQNTPEPVAPTATAEPVVTNNNSHVETQPSAPSSINQFANLPDLHDLPTQILERIPSLNYSEHNYNNLGGSVKINSTMYHVNDQLAAGLVIDKILEDGMILHIDNYSFKMRALNSWVNM